MSGKLSRVSPRKIAANRRNALKSTGPKTPQGKMYSQRNSLKHGLFARHWVDCVVLGEDPEEYNTLLNDFCDQYRPIGRAEELEVERIAHCWLRLQRAWRFENAICHIGVRDFSRKEIEYQHEFIQELRRKDEAIVIELKNAKNTIEHTRGTLPEDLKPRIFTIDPDFEPIWSVIERNVENELKALLASKKVPELPPEESAWLVSLKILMCAIAFVEMNIARSGVGVRENAVAQHLVPKRDEGERLFRYETSIERNLGRALDRLERLQRRRRGEPLLPPVSVRLSR